MGVDNENIKKLRAMTEALSVRASDVIKVNDAIDSDIVWSGIFDKIQDCLCVATTNTFFKNVNVRFCEVLGYTKKEMLETPYTSFVHPDDLEKTYAQAGKIGANKPTAGFRNRYKKKSGEYVTLEWSSAMYSDNKILAMARVIED